MSLASPLKTVAAISAALAVTAIGAAAAPLDHALAAAGPMKESMEVRSASVGAGLQAGLCCDQFSEMVRDDGLGIVQKFEGGD